MTKKNQIFITDLLFFDEGKFRTHFKKRRKDDGIKTEKEYLDIIKNIVLNFDKAYEIIHHVNDNQLLLVNIDDWLLIFSKINFRINTCMRLDDRYENVEEFLNDIIPKKKDINYFKEVDYDDSKFKRIIEKIQRQD